MSDTPRTDEAIRQPYGCDCEYVDPDFARQLERELDEERTKIEELVRFRQGDNEYAAGLLKSCAELQSRAESAERRAAENEERWRKRKWWINENYGDNVALRFALESSDADFDTAIASESGGKER